MHGTRAPRQVLNTKRIKVDLSLQIVEGYDGEQRIHRFECVSGDQEHPTDRGTFRIMRKHHPYRSRTYDVPMNYAMFFTTDGRALHQYHGPLFNAVRTLKQSDWFGSHGCVRLKEEDARILYEWAPVGTSVHVF